MQHAQHLFFLDIETVPVTDDFSRLSERMQIEWGKKSKLISKDNNDADPALSFAGRAGVYSEFAKVVCIGFGSLHHTDGQWNMRLKALYGDDEKAVLTDFADMVNRFCAYSPQMMFCGHNIKEFDIPFLCRRMLINDVTIPAVMNMSGKKPWDNPHQDTLELWKFGDFKNYTSLALLAEVLGIPSPKEDIDGSMVAEVYYREHNLQRIASYCLLDVATSARVYLRLKDMPIHFETVLVDGE